MKEIKINLEDVKGLHFLPDMKSISGNPEGGCIYEYVKSYIDFTSDEVYKIIFPDNLLSIGASITVGFNKKAQSDGKLEWLLEHCVIEGNTHVIKMFARRGGYSV